MGSKLRSVLSKTSADILGKEISLIVCAVSENDCPKFLHYAGYA
jgi:hypothetical protein